MASASELEPEFLLAAPRELPWIDAGGKPHYCMTELATAAVARGRLDEKRLVGQCNEGPDYELHLSWREDGKTRRGIQKFGFDSYHFGVGSPETSAFFERLENGDEMTIVLLGTPSIYGLLDPYFDANPNALVANVLAATPLVVAWATAWAKRMLEREQDEIRAILARPPSSFRAAPPAPEWSERRDLVTELLMRLGDHAALARLAPEVRRLYQVRVEPRLSATARRPG